VVGRSPEQATAAVIQRKGETDAEAKDAITKETAKYLPNFVPPGRRTRQPATRSQWRRPWRYPEYLRFAKTRMKSTIRNKIRTALRSVPGGGAFVRRARTSKQIKEKAAVKASGKAPGTAVTDPAFDNIPAELLQRGP
jgi:hypothetical protein